MDLGEQRFFGGFLGAGLELAFGGGLRGVAGGLADELQVVAQSIDEAHGDDLVVLDLRLNRRGAGDDAEEGAGVADFGQLMLVEQAVVFVGLGHRRGGRVGGGGCGCGGVAHIFNFNGGWELGVG